MSPRFLSYTLFFVVVTLSALSNNPATNVNAWSAVSTSSFGGRVLSSSIQNGARMEMKKGKANVPPQMRGQYKKQQEMARMQKGNVSGDQTRAGRFTCFQLVCSYQTSKCKSKATFLVVVGRYKEITTKQNLYEGK